MNREVVDDILVHYGTKGMKWGVRKKTAEVSNPGYSKDDRDLDRAVYGKGGVRRINSRMNAGKTQKQATRSETIRYVGINSAAIGAGMALKLLVAYGPILSKGISDRAETNRGRNFSAVKFGLGQNDDINAKQNRKGVYNVTSM